MHRTVLWETRTQIPAFRSNPTKHPNVLAPYTNYNIYPCAPSPSLRVKQQGTSGRAVHTPKRVNMLLLEHLHQSPYNKLEEGSLVQMA